MQIGILADIHGDVVNLKSALDRLGDERVDEIVLLGDVIYDSRTAVETVALLEDCGAVGVWGNHDLGLCVEPNDEVLRRFSRPVVQFFRGLVPRFELGELLFTHSFPTVDPEDPVAYYLPGRPEDDAMRARCFADCAHRVMLIGHFHQWFAATERGRTDWDGTEPLLLHPDSRHLVVIDAVMNGSFAVFDDATNLLSPHRCE